MGGWITILLPQRMNMTKQKEVQEACMPIMAKLHQGGGGMPEGMSGMPNMNNQDGPTVEEVD